MHRAPIGHSGNQVGCYRVVRHCSPPGGPLELVPLLHRHRPATSGHAGLGPSWLPQTPALLPLEHPAIIGHPLARTGLVLATAGSARYRRPPTSAQEKRWPRRAARTCRTATQHCTGIQGGRRAPWWQPALGAGRRPRRWVGMGAGTWGARARNPTATRRRRTRKNRGNQSRGVGYQGMGFEIRRGSGGRLGVIVRCIRTKLRGGRGSAASKGEKGDVWLAG